MEHTTDQAQSQTESGLKERFYRQFQHDVAALHEQIEQLSTPAGSTLDRGKAVDDCLAGIDSLSHLVKDASSYLPAYDRRAYAESVKTLSEKLQKIRSATAPAKKFQFRSTHKTILHPSSGAPQQVQQREVPISSDAEHRGLEAAASTKKSIDISNLSDVHVNLKAADYPTPGSGSVTNLNRCVINLSPPTEKNGPHAGLSLKDIKNSLILCGHVDGPVHITGLQNCVLVTACRQFRMHTSTDTDVYLHCSSRPIIEDCNSIRFAPFPDMLATPAILGTPDQWNQIDDFKWLRSEPSPHFSFLDRADWIDKEKWRLVIEDRNEAGISLVDVVMNNSKFLPGKEVAPEEDREI